MPTPRETILAALQARLHSITYVTVLRGRVVSERVPATDNAVLVLETVYNDPAYCDPTAATARHKTAWQVIRQEPGSG